VIHRVDLQQGETIRIQVHPDDDAYATVAGVQVKDLAGNVVNAEL
jgi:hypothetical protein